MNKCLFLILVLLITSGCISEQKTVSNTSRKLSATKAYNLARAAIVQEKSVTIDTIWFLNEVQKIEPDEMLKNFADEQTSKIKEDDSLLLINPKAPRNSLPLDLSSGIERYTTYLKGPFGEPKERAIQLIEEFISPDASGYVLTHQFLVLEWAKQTGLALPTPLTEKRRYLLEKIYKEQLNDSSFLDLYIERVAILLLFSEPDEKDVMDWIDAIIRQQLPDGNWKVSSIVQTYEGQTGILTPPAHHTTGLSLLALSAYLNKY